MSVTNYSLCRFRHAIPNLPVALDVNVDRMPLTQDRGFFFVGRVMPNKTLKDAVELKNEGRNRQPTH